MRIAVLLRDRCQSKRCNLECIKYCPPVRTGTETVVMGEEGRPMISEELCVGCGICVHKCPFDSIRIVGLPKELEGEVVHQYGMNGFRLYRLPTPHHGEVMGILGPNGIGKTTVISVLSGETIPNLGDLEREPSWDPVLEKYAGTELQNYLRKIADGSLLTSFKPQYVDKLPKAHKGKVGELLERVDESGRLDDVSEEFIIGHAFDRDLAKLSGGELQRVALAATFLKDADIYFFDEPSSYLDIYQRLKVAESIQSLSQTKQVVVIEHDLAVLDFLADSVHLMFGERGAYGVTSQPRGVRVAINTYLKGFLKEENVRFREREIRFEAHAPRKEWSGKPMIQFQPLYKRFKGFSLKTSEGIIREGEVVGVVGPNATGKTTFVKMLAGVLRPTRGEVEGNLKVSYKPQYIEPKFKGTVREAFLSEAGEDFETSYFKTEIEAPLNLQSLMDRPIPTLSGGELQCVAIGLCLAREADIYLIDEPSAYLDSNQRMEAARAIRRAMENRGMSGMIVDHDVYFIDLVSDSLMVFHGEPSRKGVGEGPFEMREGMNKFLKEVAITFRRDNETNRPRINKPESRLDREQKAAGEYYYA
ncbi:MAG: ribosome biogenesis/translation initiation ATPase RLI [Thermoplasmata archaeon]